MERRADASREADEAAGEQADGGESDAPTSAQTSPRSDPSGVRRVLVNGKEVDVSISERAIESQLQKQRKASSAAASTSEDSGSEDLFAVKRSDVIATLPESTDDPRAEDPPDGPRAGCAQPGNLPPRGVQHVPSHRSVVCGDNLRADSRCTGPKRCGC